MADAGLERGKIWGHDSPDFLYERQTFNKLNKLIELSIGGRAFLIGHLLGLPKKRF